MSVARAGLCALLAVSLALSVLPEALGAPLSLSYLGEAAPGSFRVDMAADPSSGAMLVAVTSAQRLDFSWLSQEGALPARPAASFEVRTLPDDPALASPRLAVLSRELAAVAYLSAWGPHLLLVDPSAGAFIADVPLPLAGEVGAFPSVAPFDGGFVASYLSLGAPSQVVAVQVSPAGVIFARGTVPRDGAFGAALVPAVPAPRLALLKASSLDLFTMGGAGAFTSDGSVPIQASAGAVSARAGALLGLFSTSAGLVRVSAPLVSLSPVTFETLPMGAGAVAVASSTSGDGMLLGLVRTTSGAFVVREDAIGRYSTAPVPDALAFASAADRFSLARLALLRGSPAAPHLETATVGDLDAVETTLEGPSTVRPADTVSFTAHLRAVRSTVTVVGLEVALPQQWSATVPPVWLTLPLGASAEVTFSLSVPPGASPGPYTLALKPAALEVTSPTSASITVTVPAGPSSVEALCCPAAFQLAPGESRVVSVSVVNRAAQPVTTDVSPQAPAGFLVFPSRTAVSLAPGATAQVALTVTVPQGTMPLESGVLTVLLRPDDGSAPSQIEVGAAVRAVFAPSLLVTPRDLSAAPGVTVAVPYAVANMGNVGGLVALAGLVLGLPQSALQGLPPLVFVQAYSRVDLPLTLTLPGEAMAGTSFEVSVAASRAVGGQPIGSGESMWGTVRPTGSLSARIVAGLAVGPGAEGQASLLLENGANAARAVDLAFGELPEGFAAHIEGASSRVVVEAFSAATVALVFRSADRALPGHSLLPVTATPVGAWPISLSLPVEVLEAPALAVRMLTPSVTLSGARTHEATIDFEVTNGGNAVTLLLFDSSARLVWLRSLPAQGAAISLDPSKALAVDPFETRTLRAAVAASFGPGEDLIHARLTIESTAGQRASASFDLTRLRSDPVVTDLRVRPLGSPGLAGEVYQVLGTVSNAGDGAAVGLEVVLTADGTVVGARRTVESLNPGAALTFDFEFVPRKASTELTLLVLPAESALDLDGGNNERTVTLAVALPAPPPNGAVEAAPAAAASLSFFALVALALSEVGKSTLISVLFLPLYVKLKPNEVLDQYLRGQIHGYIIANPGEHYNAIKEQLGVTNGALAYHLRVLERSGYIRPTREGMYKRFWPVGMKIPKRRRLSIVQAAVVKAVRDNPDASQKRIAELLGVSNQVINYHVKELEQANVLKVDRTHRSSRLSLGPEAPPADEGLLPPVPGSRQPTGQ